MALVAEVTYSGERCKHTSTLNLPLPYSTKYSQQRVWLKPSGAKVWDLNEHHCPPCLLNIERTLVSTPNCGYQWVLHRDGHYLSPVLMDQIINFPARVHILGSECLLDHSGQTCKQFVDSIYERAQDTIITPYAKHTVLKPMDLITLQNMWHHMFLDYCSRVLAGLSISREREVTAQVAKYIERCRLAQEGVSALCKDPFWVDFREVRRGSLRDHESECPICMDTYANEDECEFGLGELPVRTYCGHVVGDQCLGVWASGDKYDPRKCPMCRHRFNEVITDPLPDWAVRLLGGTEMNKVLTEWIE